MISGELRLFSIDIDTFQDRCLVVNSGFDGSQKLIAPVFKFFLVI